MKFTFVKRHQPMYMHSPIQIQQLYSAFMQSFDFKRHLMKVIPETRHAH
jgi:hypothetical protein